MRCLERPLQGEGNFLTLSCRDKPSGLSIACRTDLKVCPYSKSNSKSNVALLCKNIAIIFIHLCEPGFLIYWVFSLRLEMNRTIVMDTASISFCRRVVFKAIAAMPTNGNNTTLTTGFRYGCPEINCAAGGLSL